MAPAFPASSLDGLCALEITVNNLGSPAYMWAFAQRLEDGHYLLADRESLTQADMQKGIIGWAHDPAQKNSAVRSTIAWSPWRLPTH